jgi:hypothetical protein
MKWLRMVYLGNFKTFIIYIKTKYTSVLSIACHPQYGAVTCYYR